MILVLVPLKIERDVLRAALNVALGGPADVQLGNGIRALKYPGLILAVGGHGKVQFALTAGAILGALKVDLFVCAGAAGALDPQLVPNQVLAGEQTIEHDFHLKFFNRPAPRLAGHSEVLAFLRVHHADIKAASIASGDEDIVDRARAASLRRETGASAVAWEGAGGARAARFYRVPFLELRAITDHAGATAIVEFKNNLEKAMAALVPPLLTLRAFAPSREVVDRIPN